MISSSQTNCALRGTYPSDSEARRSDATNDVRDRPSHTKIASESMVPYCELTPRVAAGLERARASGAAAAPRALPGPLQCSYAVRAGRGGSS